MEPTLREGDRLLVRYAAVPAVGGLVLARFADGTLAVKRAAERRALRTGRARVVAALRQPGRRGSTPATAVRWPTPTCAPSSWPGCGPPHGWDGT